MNGIEGDVARDNDTKFQTRKNQATIDVTLQQAEDYSENQSIRSKNRCSNESGIVEEDMINVQEAGDSSSIASYKSDLKTHKHVLEFNAAIRSLITNIFLCFILVAVFVSLSISNDIITTLIASSMNSFVPIMTSLANFEKVYIVFHIYMTNFISKFKCVSV